MTLHIQSPPLSRQTDTDPDEVFREGQTLFGPYPREDASP